MENLFSTEDVHPRDRFSYWRDVACKTCVEIKCETSVGPSFRGSIWSGALSDISVAVVDTDQCTFFRTFEGTRRTKSDDVLLSLQLAGTSLLSQDGRETQLSAGDFALYDTQRTYELVVPSGGRLLILRLPRRGLEQRLGAIARYSAIGIKETDPLGGFASGYLSLLPSRVKALEGLPSHVANELSQQVLDVVCLAFRNAIDESSAALSSSRALTLARLKAAIGERLTDASLKPSVAAAAVGVSTRYANDLLSEEGTSLERYIMLRRLELCGRALTDPLQRGRSISDIAFSWGFSDLSHFGRRFREHFGYTPRDYRAAFMETEGPPNSCALIRNSLRSKNRSAWCETKRKRRVELGL